MKTIFFGTPAFCELFLDALISSGCVQLVGVVTRPARPSGRNMELKPSPVSLWAAKRGVRVIDPEKLDGKAVSSIREAAPDLGIVVAYGRILPEEILDIFPKGCINIHFSMLPKYRGAAPVQRAIMNGESKTGVTCMFLDAGLDEGDILIQEEVRIEPSDTFSSLLERLSRKGTGLLIKALGLIAEGAPNRRQQDGSKATYAPPVKREESPVDWTSPASTIVNRVRALFPWPLASTVFRSMELKILSCSLYEGEGFPGISPGCIAGSIKGRGLIVSAGQGYVVLDKVQLPGRHPISGYDLVNGYRAVPGEQLGR